MANFNTVNDLLEYSLFRAGEFTTGNLSGDYYNATDGGTVLGYVNDVIEGLVLGSPLPLTGENGHGMPLIDWWWARKQPAGVLALSAPNSTGTVSIDKGQTLLTFSSLLSVGSALVGSMIVGSAIVGGAIDLTGYRIKIGSSRYRPRIVSVNTTGNVTLATIDSAWPDDTQTDATFTVYKLEYGLPDDFVRFAGSNTLSRYPYVFDVVDVDTLEMSYPISQTFSGAPRLAALLSPSLLRLSHYTADLERIEFPYIYLPAALTLTSTDLILPATQRRILAVGAAYYILTDKSDTKNVELGNEFLSLYRTLVNEHGRQARKMSKNAGMIQSRYGQVRSLIGQGYLRTESGIVIGS